MKGFAVLRGTYLFFPRTRVSVKVTAIRRFFSSWLLAASAARASVYNDMMNDKSARLLMETIPLTRNQ